MTSAPTPFAVGEALRQSPYPVLAVDLDQFAILGANEAAYELLERPPNSLEGVPVLDLASSVQPPSPAALHLLASGVIEGYRALRRFRRPDGTEFSANVFVRLATTGGSRFGLVGIEPEPALSPLAPFDANTKIALAVTDHDWTIEHVSTDAESILGRSADAYKGVPLLGLFHPADVQSLVSAVEHVSAEGGTATLRARLRLGEVRWRDVWCLVVAMCRHSPPRLGLVISAALPESSVQLNSEFHRRLCAMGDDVLDGMGRLRSRIPSGSFSTRQWEILTRLVRGERTSDIAAALYLSPSTVRNHLSAIYKKFGVHSQAELLAEFLEALR